MKQLFNPLHSVIKMKVLSMVYRTDLVIFFITVVLFGMMLNLLTWWYEPPDVSKIDLSPKRQQELIKEWKQIYLSKIENKDTTQHYNGSQYSNTKSNKLKRSKKSNTHLQRKNEHNLVVENYNDVDEDESDYNNLQFENSQKRFETPEEKFNRIYANFLKENKLSEHTKNDKNLDSHSLNLKYSNIHAPIGGKLRGGQAQCTIHDVNDDITADYECINLAIKPTVKVCLYPNEKDIHISQHIRNVGLWEPHIVKEFQNIMFSNPDYGFIDIGANIGQYSLIAARLGHPVVAVEPFKENIRHLHMAVKLGKFEDKITVIRNAVSDKRLNYASLWVDPKNHGGVRLDRSVKDPCIHENCTKSVKSIYMDDLLEVINFKKAVIKIDVEGYEHRAFVHSTLLFEKVYISHIIMEWMQQRAYYGTEITESENKDLVYEMVAKFQSRGYTAYSLVTGIHLKNELWYTWPDDIIWKHELEDFN